MILFLSFSLVLVSIVKTCASFFNSLLGVWNVVWNFVFDFPAPEMYNTKSYHCLTLIFKVQYCCCAFLLFKNWAAIYVKLAKKRNFNKVLCLMPSEFQWVEFCMYILTRSKAYSHGRFLGQFFVVIWNAIFFLLLQPAWVSMKRDKMNRNLFLLEHVCRSLEQGWCCFCPQCEPP